jgi:hypothetical protein
MCQSPDAEAKIADSAPDFFRTPLLVAMVAFVTAIVAMIVLDPAT